MKVDLSIFKDEKTKDPVTYCSWQLDMTIFPHLGCDDQHVLPYVFQSLQEFLGDLVRSLGEDATLGDILQTLDEHYGVVMTFNGLSKELYTLKQGSGKNVAKFGVQLPQQVQILLTEYLSSIQLEHVEEMGCYHFYEGLNPKYQ